MAEEEKKKRLEEEITIPILLSDRIIKSIEEAESFKSECSEVSKLVDRIYQMLRSLFKLSSTNSLLYEPPIRRIISELTRNLDRTLTLVRKCKKSGFFNRVVTITITSVTDFRKIINLLESSVGDLKWLLSVFDYSSLDSTGGGGGGITLSLPPIASNDPILAWVWSYLASILMGSLPDRIEAANSLASLALDNDRNKKLIVEEGGIPPLLKLLKDGASPDSQLAAATALSNLATNQDWVRQIMADLGVPIIVQVLNDSSMTVQTIVANLVSRMAENDPAAQEEFDREKAIRPLVSLLSIDTILDENKTSTQSGKPHNFHDLVQIKKELGGGSNLKTSKNHYSLRSSSSSDGSSHGRNYRKDRENEKPELKLKLKTQCAEALRMLSKGSVSNSRRITETKGLFCLAKIIENETGELQLKCLMVVMEIAAAAESNADLRRAAFKTNSPAAKAIVDQLIRLVQQENDPLLQIPAIRSIGSLARTFPAKETRVIGLLVNQLGNKSTDVATEVATALEKFACPDNFLCDVHTKAIVEFGGVTPLMKLLRANEQARKHGIIVLCYLALNAASSEGLERVRSILEGAASSPFAQDPHLKELISKAISHLEIYQSGIHSLIPSYPT